MVATGRASGIKSWEVAVLSAQLLCAIPAMLSAGITASGLEDRIGMGGQVTSTSWEGHIKSSTANSSGAS